MKKGNKENVVYGEVKWTQKKLRDALEQVIGALSRQKMSNWKQIYIPISNSSEGTKNEKISCALCINGMGHLRVEVI